MSGGSYKDEKGTITGCNDTYPQVMEAAALRTKNYAVELMSIEYAFTGNVEFAIDESMLKTEEKEISGKKE